MASLYTNELLPTTSEEAIRQFNEKYLAVTSAASPSDWASGFHSPVSAPRVTYPMSAMSTKFLEAKEQSDRFKGFEEKSFDLKVTKYHAGFEVPLLDLKTNVFAARNWSNAPSRFKIGEQRHIASKLAALLETGTSATSPWDDVTFFHASGHKANPFESVGTFGNYVSAATLPTLANIQAQMIDMSNDVLDENGDKLQVMATEIWLPTPRYQVVSDLLNQAFLAGGESNYMSGKIKAVHVPELTADAWYLVDTNLISQGYDPMVSVSYQEPGSLGLTFWDESSDFFKDTGKLKVAQKIWTGRGFVFPHAIRRINAT
jgi:hypothetical protein